MTFIVNADGLNLRSSPDTSSRRNIIVVLNRSHRVKKISGDIEGWWLVETVVQGQLARGYVASRYLTPDSGSSTDPVVQGRIEAVHMRPPRGSVNVGHSRAYPLTGPQPLIRVGTSDEIKRKQTLGIIDYLNVEVSLRYQPSGTKTFCNIYAYDFCYLSGVYLPRVWWADKAIGQLLRGEPVHPLYDATIFEKNANSLYDWLTEWGDNFGWIRTFSLTELQSMANRGHVTIVCARRKNREASGHITAVVPETDEFVATRRDGEVVRVVESQAGTTNRKFVVRNPWWTAMSRGVAKYDGFGYWYTDATKEFIEL